MDPTDSSLATTEIQVKERNSSSKTKTGPCQEWKGQGEDVAIALSSLSIYPPFALPRLDSQALLAIVESDDDDDDDDYIPPEQGGDDGDENEIGDGGHEEEQDHDTKSSDTESEWESDGSERDELNDLIKDASDHGLIGMDVQGKVLRTGRVIEQSLDNLPAAARIEQVVHETGVRGVDNVANEA